MTVRLVAHRDSNGNGEFDPSVDEPYAVDGNPVEATVVNAVFQGGTTTTSPTTSSTTTTTPGDATTTVSTGGTTRTTLPGFDIGVVVLAFLGLAVLAHRD